MAFTQVKKRNARVLFFVITCFFTYVVLTSNNYFLGKPSAMIDLFTYLKTNEYLCRMNYA